MHSLTGFCKLVAGAPVPRSAEQHVVVRAAYDVLDQPDGQLHPERRPQPHGTLLPLANTDLISHAKRHSFLDRVRHSEAICMFVRHGKSESMALHACLL